jgi:hypothetical protein
VTIAKRPSGERDGGGYIADLGLVASKISEIQKIGLSVFRPSLLARPGHPSCFVRTSCFFLLPGGSGGNRRAEAAELAVGLPVL